MWPFVLFMSTSSRQSTGVDATATSDTDKRPDIDVAVGEALDLLADERRRHILETLHAADHHGDDGVDMRRLAQAVAAGETDSDGNDRRGRNRIFLDLHQNQVPRLEEAGVVTIDRDHEIRLTEQGETLYQLLYEVEDRCTGGDA